MSTDPSEIWSPPEGGSATAESLSPSRLSYASRSDSQRFSSDGEDPATHTRRLNISPSASQYNDDVDDGYYEGNSIDEVDATLNDFDDYGDTERSHTPWSPGSYSSTGPTFSSATGTFTYTGTYIGSPSFVSLPTFSPRSPLDQSFDPRARLSRITERTEESRPSSTAFSAVSRPLGGTPDNARRSAFLGGGTTMFHSRSSTEPSSDRTRPVPGRLGELIAVWESQSPSAGHSRAASTPSRSSSPMVGSTQPATTTSSYIPTSYGHSSRPSSPSKSGLRSAEPGTHSSLLSPPVRPSTGGFRTSTGIRSGTPSYTTPSYTTASYTATPGSAFSNTITQTGSYTTPNTDIKTIAGSEDTFTRSTTTPTSTLRKPQSPPTSPVASVRNIVASWKERTPASVRADRSSTSPASPPTTASTVSHDDDGRYGIRRRVEGVRVRLRESRGGGAPTTPTGPVSQEVHDTASVNSGRSGVFPPGFDLSEFSTYARSNEPPTHIGLLWYLNVHASPPYRWQRCQALLYPHVLLLSWLAPGGGRGIVALDLLNCTSVQSAPSLTHPIARDDVGAVAAREQSNELTGMPLVELLVPFHMMYADGVERLAAESLVERRKWENRIWEVVSRPSNVPDSVSVTRSPTGSILTILTIESDASHSSNGSRTTVFVPPLSSIPDISDMLSSPGLSRQSSIVSSHHSRTVDDTVIQNQDYVYPGDRRSITPSRGSPLKRSGSTTDIDEEFRKAVTRPRGSNVLFGSPVTVTSGSSLGKTIFIPPPPSGGRVSSDEERFMSASSDGLRSNVSSTYFSPSSSIPGSRTLTEFTPATSATQVTPSSTFTPTFLGSDYGSDVSFAQSPSTLSRARVIRRRIASTARSPSSGYQTEVSRTSSDKENEDSMSGGRTPAGTSGSYTPGSGSLSFNGSGTYGSGSYLDSRSRTPTGSYTGSYSGSERSRSRNGSDTGSGSYSGSGSYPPTGDYTPGSGSFTLQAESNIVESSSSGVGDHTPISSSETGYDICRSSDLTDFTRTMTTTTTITPIPLSPVLVVPFPVLPTETFVTASLASTEYETAAVVSSRASITSFESLPTIPGSEYWSAPSVSSYRTASEPARSSPPSVYATAGEVESIPEIPSVISTPQLSSIGLPDFEMGPIRLPSVIPTIRSPGSLFSELEAADIPLPSSVPQRASRPLPSHEVPQLPQQIAQPFPSVPQPIAQPLPSVPQLISRPLPSLPQPISQLPPLPPLPPVPQPEVPLDSQPQSSVSPTTPTPVTAASTPRRIEHTLPPLPPSLPSRSPSLSPTPSPLSPSTIERDVATPTTLQLPPLTTESSVTDDLSLLSSLPSSTLESTSVITPTSLVVVSSSVVSTLPPSPRPISVTRTPSSSLSVSSVTLSSFTESSSPIPPSPHAWATATDLSYESSILRPSPSLRSVMLPEGMEVSFETSILRPTGSPSSIGRMSTIPPSPAPVSITAHSPLPPLTPVPALPPSLSSATDIETPTTLDFTTESSSISISRTHSISSSSYSTESSLTPSTIDFDGEEPPVEFPSPSTEPSLLSIVQPPSEHPSVPSPPPAARIPTPEGTVIVSITTPQGSGPTEQSSLRTLPSSISALTQRDLGRDFDRLADAVQTNDQARGLEYQDMADNFRALRDEFRDLADYLRRTPPPRTPVAVPRTPSPRAVSPDVAPEVPPRFQLVDQPAGDSIDLSPIFPGVVEVVVPAPASSLLRSTSHASSVQSYLSSHHSDDDIFEAELETPLPSSAVWEAPTSEITEVTSSSSISSSPVTPSSDLESEATTTMPEAPEALGQALRGIQDQLHALEDGQNNARNLLEALQRQPEDHTPELAERLRRIENLIQVLLDQGHPRGPELPLHPPSPSRTGTISDSTDSLRRLRSILRDLATPADAETRHMPVPMVAPAGPSIAQQLDEILSAAQVPPTTPSDLPRIQPFLYRPADRGARARSISPTSMELPRSRTVPLVFPMPVRSAMRPRREPSEPELPGDMGIDRGAPEQVYRDGRRLEPDRFHVGPGPTPQPVFPTTRPITAPPDIGGDVPGGPAVSWYRTPKPSTSTGPAAAAPGAPGAPGAEPGGVRYMPMPAGPTVVQLPPLFDSLMEILRENRLAQLATVDQQRELMRYMRGLNEWLEQDVRDRQTELRGVYTLVEQLGRELRNMQARGHPPSTPSSTEESETAIRYNFPVGPPPPFPGAPHGFQPFPVDQGVVPNVIPDHRPAPQPTIILQQPGQVIPGGVPPIPRPEYHPGGPGPQPSTRVPSEEIAFIPPSRASTGTPLPTLPVHFGTPAPTRPYSSMGTNVVPVGESPPSSESPSTPSRRPRRRRDSSTSHRSYDSRSPSPLSRRDSRPLTVTNGPDVHYTPGPPPIHVVSPSQPSMHGPMPGQPMPAQQGQPTIIYQQPPQVIPGQAMPPPPMTPYPQPVTEIGVPMHPSMPPITIPVSEYSPGSHDVPLPGVHMPGTPAPQPYPMTTMGPQPYPMTPIPTMGPQPYPMTVPTVGQPYPMGPPVVIQGSPRSTPSPRGRRSSPPQAPVQPQQPIIIETGGRRSRSRSHSPPPIMTVPTGFPPMGPAMVPAPVIMQQGSPPRRRDSSRSRTPDRGQPIIMQPTMPSMYPPPVSTVPQTVLAPGMAPFAPTPVVLPSQYPRSRTPSPHHHHAAPPVILQQEPHRRRSYSYSPRRRSYSPRYRRRSPLYERDRPYDRGPYDHERPHELDRRYGRRGYSPSRDESYSRSPPRRRRHRSSDVSRSPTRYYGPPTTYAPISQAPSQHYPRRSPPYVEVIDIPQHPRRRERSLSPDIPQHPRRRERSLSPVHRRRSPSPEYGPREHRGRHTGRRASISPPYSRSVSPYPSPTQARFRPFEGAVEGRGESRADERGAEGRGAEGRGAEGRGAEERGAEGRGAEGRGAEGRGAEGRGAEGRGAEGRGAEGRGAEGRGAEGRGAEMPPRRATPGFSPGGSPITGLEDVTRSPILVTVPAPTSRPPRHLAEVSPEMPMPVTPGFPSEPFESEEPFRTPRRSDLEDRAGGPPIVIPISDAAERETVPIARRPRTPLTVVGYPPIEDPRDQIEALNRAADRLQMTVDAAEQAEDRREGEYRQREDERMQSFLEREAQRNEDARQRADAIWRDLEERLFALPPVPVVPLAEKPEPEEERAEIESIEATPQQVAARPADDVMEMIQLARDEFAKEHDRLADQRTSFFDQLREEKDSIIEEKDNRIRALEDELQQLRGEFQSERQQYATEETDRREQERQERMAESNDMRAQISDLTNLVQDSRNMIEEMKANGDARYMEKQTRRQDKEAQMIENRDMIQKTHDDIEAVRVRSEDDKRDIMEALERQNEDLQRQIAELRELLQMVSDTWREDCQKHHEETIEAVRATADKQVPFNVQGYLDEFSQALAAEVRMLLGEVGKIREERRALQHEIGELLTTRSKYGPGGEYEPDWRPPGPPPPPPETMGPGGPDGPAGGPDEPPPGGIPPPKPAWRTVHQKASKKKKRDAGPSTSASAPPPVSQHPQHLMPPTHGYGHERQLLARSWDTWQPDRAAVTPPSVEATLAVPGRQSPGLFGPRTPSTNSNSIYERR